MLLISCLVLLIINSASCKDCVLNNGSRQLNKEKELHKILLQDYAQQHAPQNTTKVAVRFILKTFNYDSEEVVFSMYNWLFFRWMDERLKWDPKEYEGISETELYAHLIWTPILQHLTDFDFGYYAHIHFYNTRCEVKSSGQVSCVVRTFIQTECSSNLTDWPFDLQSCTFKFGAAGREKCHVVYTFNSTRGISMLGAEYGAGWDIIDFEKGENATSETQIYLRFIVERHGVGLAATIIVPSLVVSALTISSLFLDFGNTRLGMTSFSLYGHFGFLRYISIIIPRHGATTPTVLRYMMGSLSITSIAFLLSLVFKFLQRGKIPTPPWVCTVNKFVSTSPGRFLIWPFWEATRSEDSPNKTVKDWMDFANIINSVFIVIATIIYLSTFLAYIPHELPYDYDAL